MGYSPIFFDAVDEGGKLIYHTNVLMWVGTKVAAVCLEAIPNPKVKIAHHLLIGLLCSFLFCRRGIWCRSS